jgi:hypothetical protein
MATITGYSTAREGYIYHNETGTTWGNHPGDYDGGLIIEKDEHGVTVHGGSLTQEQQEALEEGPITAEIADCPVVSAPDEADAMAMMHEGP